MREPFLIGYYTYDYARQITSFGNIFGPLDVKQIQQRGLRSNLQAASIWHHMILFVALAATDRLYRPNA